MTVEAPQGVETTTPDVKHQLDLHKEIISIRPTLGAEVHDVLTSKKFWALVIALVTDFFEYNAGHLDTQTFVLGVIGVVAAYCIGQGIADNAIKR